MATVDEVAEALRSWARGDRRPLLDALGYEPINVTVPAAALSDFGLSAGDVAELSVVARFRGLDVFHVRLANGVTPERVRGLAARLYRRNPARRALLLFSGERGDSFVVASWGLGPGPFHLRRMSIDPCEPRRSALDILASLAVGDASTGAELALAHARALDRESLTRQFFLDFRHQRALLAAALKGVPDQREDDRLELALSLLGRLLFLYFVQRKGWLNRDPDYLLNLFRDARREGIPFFRRRLEPLFFGALNRSPEKRSKRARALGELPYLNGGLFERNSLERRYRKLDVPDDALEPIFVDLLDRYQFTLREDQPADQDVAVDPEMIGRVFEGLMAEPARGSTGAFYTPRALVDQLVVGALAAHLADACGCTSQLASQLLNGTEIEVEGGLRERLREHAETIRVLDPAVGSGAFLLAALCSIERLLDSVAPRPSDRLELFRRRERIIQRSLHGVDINAAAVRLCELRLWLALIVDLEVEGIADVPPLPNLDLNVRQGDALVDPIDFVSQFGDGACLNLVGRWRRVAGKLAKYRAEYFGTFGEAKRRVGTRLRRAEHRIALGFLGELDAQLEGRRADLVAIEDSENLFGDKADLTRRQRLALDRIDTHRSRVGRLISVLREQGEVPFFSFPVHFADPSRPSGSFDVIVGNPPWIRVHRWPALARTRLKERFRFLRDAGWRAGAQLAGTGRGFGAQLDLSALFLEKSLDLLGEHGALGFLLPAKLVRALYGSGVRARLSTKTRILRIEDCSLASQSHFEATTYPLAILISNAEPAADHPVRVRLHTRDDNPIELELPQRDLSLLASDQGSPWAFAPVDVRRAIQRMLAAGAPLGSTERYRPQRGVVTGANTIFLGELDGRPYPDGKSSVRLGENSVPIERACLCPALRGEDIAPWSFAVRRVLIWTHDSDGHVLPKLPKATAAYLRRHENALQKRKDLRPGQRFWTQFRVKPSKWSLRVAWRDIGADPAAVVIPEGVGFGDETRPLIGLNTLYHIATPNEDDAHLLAAILNSTVARAFLKSYAERAAGGCFRFFGWTVGLLPFPSSASPRSLAACVAQSRRAHARGTLAPGEERVLDLLVGKLYKLSEEDVAALRHFDARLRGAENQNVA